MKLKYVELIKQTINRTIVELKSMINAELEVLAKNY